MTKIAWTAPLMALACVWFCADAPARAVDRMPAVKPAPTKASHLTVSVRGDPKWRGRGGDEGVMRVVASAGDVTSWLLPTDPELKTADSVLFKDPAVRWADVRLELTAGPNGLATGCGASVGRNAIITPAVAALTEALCRRISPRARFHPALDEDGKPIVGIFVLHLSLGHDEKDEALPRIQPILLVPVPPPPPVAMPTPSVDKPGWPPSRQWLRAYYSRPEFSAKMPVVTAAALADHTPWAGVILAAPDTGQPFCTVSFSSGVPAIDRKACDFAAHKAKPLWGGALPAGPAPADIHLRQLQSAHHHVPMIVTLYRGKPAAILLREAGATSALLSPAAQADLVSHVVARWPEGSRDALRKVWVELRITAAGKVTHCHLDSSIGSDAGDIAYCRTMLDSVLFDPARDVFGVPLPEDSYLSFRLPA